MNRFQLMIFIFTFLFLSGCENTDLQTALDAGSDALKAVTLSDKELFEIAEKTSQYSDERHTMAPPESHYTVRLRRIVGQFSEEGEIKFSYGVYLSPEVNAFAMANGTIRIYSGLMDLLKDGELRFVIGHEMGHVAKNHVNKKIRMAYAASAVRKGVASQNGISGQVARSQLGGLAETLFKAQFSQFEEKEADDYGLAFLKKENGNPRDAVSALKKLAILGRNHSFLSSHPDPENRAARLQSQLEGKTLPIEKTQQNIFERIKVILEKWLKLFTR